MVKLMILCSLLTAATTSLGAHSAIKQSDAERLGLIATRIGMASPVAGELLSSVSPSDLSRSASPRAFGKTLSTESVAGSPVVFSYPGLPDLDQNTRGMHESHKAIARTVEALRSLTRK